MSCRSSNQSRQNSACTEVKFAWLGTSKWPQSCACYLLEGAGFNHRSPTQAWRLQCLADLLRHGSPGISLLPQAEQSSQHSSIAKGASDPGFVNFESAWFNVRACTRSRIPRVFHILFHLAYRTLSTPPQSFDALLRAEHTRPSDASGDRVCGDLLRLLETQLVEGCWKSSE